MYRERIFILIVFVAFSFTTVDQTTRQHGVFRGRLILADRINDKWKWELFVQKERKTFLVKRTSLALHYNSVWCWFNYGFSLEVVKNIKTSFSYLNIFQQRTNGKDFDDAHALLAVVTFDNLFSQFRKP